MKNDEAQCIVLGFVFCIFMVKVLKRILKMPRPEKSNTYGMPSTRGTELGFLLACIFLLAPGLTVEAKALMAFAVLMCLYLKWNTEQHSVNQLVAGALLGGFTGYVLVEVFVKD